MKEITYPLKCEIKIDFCQDKKKFYLSTPISSAIHQSIHTYVESRKNRSFKPYQTSFNVDDQAVVSLVQEIPFRWGHQPSIRQLTSQFWCLAKHCHKMLSELAIEETYQIASQKEIE